MRAQPQPAGHGPRAACARRKDGGHEIRTGIRGGALGAHATGAACVARRAAGGVAGSERGAGDVHAARGAWSLAAWRARRLDGARAPHPRARRVAGVRSL